MTDAVSHADLLEQRAHLAWREYCALVQAWVAQGQVSAEAGAYACDDHGKEVWIRAYLRAGRRSAGLSELAGLDDLDGSG